MKKEYKNHEIKVKMTKKERTKLDSLCMLQNTTISKLMRGYINANFLLAILKLYK